MFHGRYWRQLALICLLAPASSWGQDFNFEEERHRELLLAPIKTALKAYGNNLKNANYQPSLSQKARGEAKVIESVLRAEGFYQGEVKPSVDEGKITYDIRADQAYRIQHIGIEAQDGVKLPKAKLIPLAIGQRLRAEEVLAAQQFIKNHIIAKNCLYEVKLDYSVQVNKESLEADVRFKLSPSESVRYGELNFSGLRNIKEEYLRDIIKLPEEGCFKRGVVDNKVLLLFQTNLFSRVEAEIGQAQEGLVPITFALKERNLRTIKTGLGYTSDLGATLSLGWEHRNLGGHAEKLELDTTLSRNTTEIGARLTFPAFLSSQRQSLVLETSLEKERTDAFESVSLENTGTFSRILIPKLTGSLGARYKRVTVTEANGEEDDFSLLGLPISLEFDGRGDPLDPLGGELIGIKVEPLIDTLNTDTQFTKTTFRATTYQTARKTTFKPSLALRVELGSITGDQALSVPADERFYSGGGGSVRGYNYQSLGPREDGDPIGGRSLIELSAEARFRFTDTWGAVLFTDGGNVFEAQWPEEWQDLYWSWGVGLRYFTSFAPIRVDVGFPTDPREDVDDDYQLYISLGQAF